MRARGRGRDREGAWKVVVLAFQRRKTRGPDQSSRSQADREGGSKGKRRVEISAARSQSGFRRPAANKWRLHAGRGVLRLRCGSLVVSHVQRQEATTLDLNTGVRGLTVFQTQRNE